jgi:putative hemolysin
VCGPPAIDRRFKTIDFLVLLDVAGLTPRAHRLFFGG